MQIILLGFSLLFAVIGALLIASARTTSATGRRFDADVIGFVASIGNKGSRTFKPVLLFRHPRAGRCVLQHSIGSGTPTYAVGQKVKIVVDEKEPMRGRIDSSGPLWFGGIFLVLGIVLTVVVFTAFRLTAFSVAVLAAAAIAIVVKARNAEAAVPGAAQLRKIVREATTSEVSAEGSFDRSTLVPQAELESIQRGQPKQALIAGVICLVVGAGGLVTSWFWVQKRFAFLETAVATDGVVVDMIRSHSSKGGTKWAPLIEFTPAGRWEPVRFRHNVESTSPSWRIGDKVRVLYDPNRPDDAMTDWGFWNRVTPFLPGGGGALMLLLAWFSIRSAMKKREPMQRHPAPVLH